MHPLHAPLLTAPPLLSFCLLPPASGTWAQVFLHPGLCCHGIGTMKQIPGHEEGKGQAEHLHNKQWSIAGGAPVHENTTFAHTLRSQT